MSISMRVGHLLSQRQYLAARKLGDPGPSSVAYHQSIRLARTFASASSSLSPIRGRSAAVETFDKRRPQYLDPANYRSARGARSRSGVKAQSARPEGSWATRKRQGMDDRSMRQRSEGRSGLGRRPTQGGEAYDRIRDAEDGPRDRSLLGAAQRAYTSPWETSQAGAGAAARSAATLRDTQAAEEATADAEPVNQYKSKWRQRQELFLTRGKFRSGATTSTPSTSVGRQSDGADRRSRSRPSFDTRMNGRRPRKIAVDNNDTPHDTARRVEMFIAKYPRASGARRGQSDKLVKAVSDIVMSATKQASNAVAWNQVFGYVGRLGHLGAMWQLFSEMRKRGVKPTTRTYTVLLNAYAGVAHSEADARYQPARKVPPRLAERVNKLYADSQEHIVRAIGAIDAAEEATEDVGLEAEDDAPLEDPEATQRLAEEKEEVSLGPTNAYLKFLGRYGLWQRMDRIFVAMDDTGPLAPDRITYTLMFNALNNRHATQFMQPPQLPQDTHGFRQTFSAVQTTREFEVGDKARLLWDRMVKAFHPVLPDKDGNIVEKPRVLSQSARRRTRQIDESLVVAALQALRNGRPVDQQLVTALIPHIFRLPSVAAINNLPSETSAVPPSSVSVPPPMAQLPVLRLSIYGATSILHLLTKLEQHELAGAYASHFLREKKAGLLPSLNDKFFEVASHVFSLVGDVRNIEHILTHYQPNSQEHGWPMSVWHKALVAARQARNWTLARDLFRRMTHLRSGVEAGLQYADQKPYSRANPNGKPRDIRGTAWVRMKPREPDSRIMSQLLRTALAVEEPGALLQAWRIFEHFGAEKWWTIEGGRLEGGRLEGGGKESLNMLAPPFQFQGGLTGRGGADELQSQKEVRYRVKLAQDVDELAGALLRHQGELKALDSGRGKQSAEKTMDQVAHMREQLRGIVQRWGIRAGVSHRKTDAAPLVASTGIMRANKKPRWVLS